MLPCRGRAFQMGRKTWISWVGTLLQGLDWQATWETIRNLKTWAWGLFSTFKPGPNSHLSLSVNPIVPVPWLSQGSPLGTPGATAHMPQQSLFPWLFLTRTPGWEAPYKRGHRTGKCWLGGKEKGHLEALLGGQPWQGAVGPGFGQH